MTDQMPPTAGKTGIPREVRDRIMCYVDPSTNSDILTVAALRWLQDHTFPLDPPWVPDPDAIQAMTVATYVPADSYAPASVAASANRLVRLHDAGWELTRTEAPR